MIVSDDMGNQLIVHDRGINLRLKSEDKDRRIFQVKGGQISKWVKPTNILNAGNMIGFNYKALQVIRERLRKKYIYTLFGTKRYKVPIDEVLDNGKFLFFKNEGFELQIFYPLKEMMKWLKK